MQVAWSDRREMEDLRLAVDVLDHVLKRIKAFLERSHLDLGVISRQDHLGSFLIQNVTLVRMTDMMGMDSGSGSREVVSSNDSKFDPAPFQ